MQIVSCIVLVPAPDRSECFHNESNTDGQMYNVISPSHHYFKHPYYAQFFCFLAISSSDEELGLIKSSPKIKTVGNSFMNFLAVNKSMERLNKYILSSFSDSTLFCSIFDQTLSDF